MIRNRRPYNSCSNNDDGGGVARHFPIVGEQVRYNRRMHPKFLNTEAHRRRFLAYFSGIGLGSSLLPGALWAQAAQQQEGGGESQINEQMVRDGLAIAGLSFKDEDVKA